MIFNISLDDSLSGVNITDFVNGPYPNRRVGVYFSIEPFGGWGRKNQATGCVFGLHETDNLGRRIHDADDSSNPVHDENVVILNMTCWKLHNRRCNNVVSRIVDRGIAYHVAYNAAKSEGLLWPLSTDSTKERLFIAPGVDVESSQELEEMIENDVLKDLERRVSNWTNEMQCI